MRKRVEIEEKRKYLEKCVDDKSEGGDLEKKDTIKVSQV